MDCVFCELGICIDVSHLENPPPLLDDTKPVPLFDITGGTTARLLGRNEFDRWRKLQSEREKEQLEKRFDSGLQQQFRSVDKQVKLERPLPYNACIGLELETNFLVIRNKKQKDVVYKDSELRIDADTAVDESDGTLEFVVTKSSSKKQLVERVRRCERIAQSLVGKCEENARKSSGGRRTKSKVSMTPICSGEALDLFGTERPTELTGQKPPEFDDVEVLLLTEATQDAGIQFTMGVPLSLMRTYLRNAANLSVYYRDRAVIIERIHEEIILSEDASPTHKVSEKWNGFLLLFGLYIYDLQVWRPNEGSEGPKNAVTVMTRTSFREMYLHLESSKRDCEEMCRVAGEVLSLVKGAPSLSKALLIAKSYPWASKNGAMKKTDITVMEWIDSILEGTPKEFRDQVVEEGISGNGEPDLLCPPDGFDTLEPRYSLGAMKMDGELVIIEHRCPELLNENGVELIDNWSTFAEYAFDFANTVLRGKDYSS